MGRPTKLSIATPLIQEFFKENRRKLYSYNDLRNMLLSKKDEWNLSRGTTVNAFITHLKTMGLCAFELRFLYETFQRFSWNALDDQIILQIAASLKPKAYFSHHSAIYLHQLTHQTPKNIYINLEQPIRPAPSGQMLQVNIDRAFKAAPRATNNYTTLGDYTIFLLSGKNTENLGVIETNGSSRVTNIERTLLDATVRPAYSGGVLEVLKAYKEAKGKVSVSKMKSYLKKIGHSYPYHQAIGFFLERAGYDDQKLKLMSSIAMKFDFYLVNQIKNPGYSKKWKIYYPKEFDSI